MLSLPLLLAQLIVVLAVARLADWLARPLGQPRVVAEMAAGLALGPSVLGAVAPQTAAMLFPADGLVPLNAVSQLGVLLFMFVVGLRLDLGVLRGQRGTAIATSQISILLPFALGLALAPRLHPTLAGSGVALRPFALFVGAAMSVTAFPVLARILADRKLTGTRVGTVAIASAAVDDVTAWCILAAVVAAARAGASFVPAILAVIRVAAFVAAMLLLVRPVLRHVLARESIGDPVRQLGLAVIVALVSALATEWLGVHALFGAFVAGAVMPRDGALARALADRLEPPIATILLPLFFAFTGLRTSVASVSGASAWTDVALILGAAVVGKLGGSMLAARATGSSWRDAFAIGALMNTRGLMELVILNVGLDVGVISPTLFAMMVVMALVTTVMTSPLLSLAGLTSPRVAIN